jgi:hypothetical protein
MKIGPIPNPRATLAFGVFFLMVNLASVLYALNRMRPSGSFVFVCYLGAALVVAYWILADSRRLGLGGSVDQGWFVFAAWPLALPYHLFKTRGIKGAVTLFGLVGLFVLTYGVSLVVFFVIRAVRFGK